MDEQNKPVNPTTGWDAALLLGTVVVICSTILGIVYIIWG